jgi:hypothetical protein
MQLKKLLGTLSALTSSLELPRPSNSSC